MYRLLLKFQWGIRSEYKNEDDNALQQAEVVEHQGSTRTKRSTVFNNHEKEQKRTKERTIGYIIEKVSQWRKLYNGYMDENH